MCLPGSSARVRVSPPRAHRLGRLEARLESRRLRERIISAGRSLVDAKRSLRGGVLGAYEQSDLSESKRGQPVASLRFGL